MRAVSSASVWAAQGLTRQFGAVIVGMRTAGQAGRVATLTGGVQLRGCRSLFIAYHGLRR